MGSIYKIGDKVVINKPLNSSLLVCHGMKKYAGMAAEITDVIYEGEDIGEDGFVYKIDTDGGKWFWASNLFRSAPLVIYASENQIEDLFK